MQHGSSSSPGSGTRRPAPWLAFAFWAVLIGLLGAIGAMALPACGLGGTEPRPWLGACPLPLPPDPRLAALDAERAREAALEEQFDRLRLALVEAPQCAPPPQVAAVPPPEPPPPEPQEVATAPPAPPPPEAPVPVHRPDPPAPPPDIPQQAWNNRDVSFLEGCWTLISPQSVQDIGTGSRQGMSNWHICFDRNGVGTQTIQIADGDRCSGGVRARFGPNGRLVLQGVGDLPCSRGRIPVINQDCERRPDGTAFCLGTQPTARARNIPSTFRR